MIKTDELRQVLRAFDDAHCALVAALVCNRLYPNYLLFTEVENWGNPRLFRAGIELLFETAAGGSRPVAQAQKLYDSLDSAFPDLDDFTSSEASYAFDASSAFDSALQFLITGEKEHVVNCSIAAFDTVDMFVQMLHEIEPNTPNVEQLIDNDPYMQKEVERQRKVIDLLRATPVISPDFITQLRKQQDLLPAIVDMDKLPEELD